MAYSEVAIVFANDSTITDSVSLFSGTIGRKPTYPNQKIDTTWTIFGVKDSTDTNIPTDTLLITTGTKEYYLRNGTLELMKLQMLNVDSSAVLRFKIRGKH